MHYTSNNKRTIKYIVLYQDTITEDVGICKFVCCHSKFVVISEKLQQKIGFIMMINEKLSLVVNKNFIELTNTSMRLQQNFIGQIP